MNLSNMLTYCVAVLLALACPPALAADSAAEVGHAIVTNNCAACHAIGRDGESPLAAAPHFRDLHLRYDVGDLSESLVEGIITAHPGMPEFVFSANDAGAIVAYLKSLER